MSERERNPGSSDSPSDLGGETPTPAKNRPAAGASQLNPGAIPRDWHGGAAATDFLGLDGDNNLEVFASDEAPLAFTQAGGPVRPGAPLPPSIQPSGGVPVAPAPLAPSPVAPGAPSEGAWLDEIEKSGVLSDDLAPAAENAPDADPRPAASDAPRRSGGRGKLLAGGLAACLLAALGAGGWWWWKNHRPQPAPEVAQVPAPVTKPTTKKPDKKPVTTVTQPAPQPGTNTGENGSTAVDPNTTTTEPVAQNPDGTEGTDGTDGVETIVDIPLPTNTDPQPTVRFPASGSDARGGETNGAPTLGTTHETTLAVRPNDVLTPTSNPTGDLPSGDHPLPNGMRRATAEDMAGLWQATALPGREQIDGPTTLRTLRVGRVRALVVGGEYFEGNLYAVGERRVSIEMELGRISFDSAVVRELIQLPPLPPVAPGAKKNKRADLANLPQVEVHLPGGAVTGRLVGRDGDRVTIVTDDGLRAVFESGDVRPLTANNTRVIGTLSKLEGTPAVTPAAAPAVQPNKPSKGPAQPPSKSPQKK